MTQYNTRGLVVAQSTPHRPGQPTLWTTFEDFDLLGRPTLKREPRQLDDIDGTRHEALLTTYNHVGRRTSISVCGTVSA